MEGFAGTEEHPPEGGRGGANQRYFYLRGEPHRPQNSPLALTFGAAETKVAPPPPQPSLFAGPGLHPAPITNFARGGVEVRGVKMQDGETLTRVRGTLVERNVSAVGDVSAVGNVSLVEFGMQKASGHLYSSVALSLLPPSPDSPTSVPFIPLFPSSSHNLLLQCSY